MNSKSDIPPHLSVDDYLAALPPEIKSALENLRSLIKAAAPHAEELISYRIPTYKYHGALVHFMAHPRHLSFVTASKVIVDSIKDELKGFKTSGTTIHFTPEKPLPAELVIKIVQARMAENEANKKK